jgi:hypothetical protein
LIWDHVFEGRFSDGMTIQFNTSLNLFRI